MTDPRPVAAQRLSVRGVGKRFGGVEVLRGIDLDLAAGDLVAVVGPSGSGKTTLGRIIAGFEPADEGTVTIDGRLVDDGRTWVPPERRRVGIVPQDGALFPHLDVAANVGAGLPRGGDRERRIDECLALVGLAERRHARPAELSGGQQQRVALARALAPRPSLIVLDEPFSALDAALRAQLRADVARALRDADATAVLITHDQDEALSMADRVAVLLGGQVVQVDAPARAYARPATLEVARFLGRVVELPAVVADGGLDTVLGRLPAATDLPDGTAAVAILRPEQLRLGDGAHHARVEQVEYLGHDAVLTIRLADGTLAAARAGTHLDTARGRTGLPGPGDRVEVSVEGSALAFPTPTQS